MLQGLLRAAELAMTPRVDKTGEQTLPKTRPILTRMVALGTVKMQQ